MPTLQRAFIKTTSPLVEVRKSWQKLMNGSVYVNLFDVWNAVGAIPRYKLKPSEFQELVPGPAESIKLEKRRLLFLQENNYWQEHLYRNIEGVGFYYYTDLQLTPGGRIYQSWMAVLRNNRLVEIPLVYSRKEIDDACEFLTKKEFPFHFLMNGYRIAGFRDKGWLKPAWKYGPNIRPRKR